MAHSSWSDLAREFVSVVHVMQDLMESRLFFGPRYCNAFIAPLSPEVIPEVPLESTVHVLPNGDMRVIQSPDNDVIQKGDDKETTSFRVGETSMSALKLEGKQHDLEKLIGAHFHIGELIVDADIESENRMQTRQSMEASPQGCFDGALRMMGNVCGTSAQPNHGLHGSLFLPLQ